MRPPRLLGSKGTGLCVYFSVRKNKEVIDVAMKRFDPEFVVKEVEKLRGLWRNKYYEVISLIEYAHEQAGRLECLPAKKAT